MASRNKKILWILLSAIALVLMALAPLGIRGYWVRLFTSMYMYAILAQAVNIIAGYCGYLALGNMVFFGLGAYVVAVLMTKFAVGFAASLVFGLYARRYREVDHYRV